jgi:hypothetical protein
MLSRRGIVATAAEPPELTTLIAQLSVLTLDLRAQYEAKVRILTEIQREIESLRAPARRGVRGRSLDRLERRFEALAAANRDASQALTMVREAFARIRRDGAREPAVRARTRA